VAELVRSDRLNGLPAASQELDYWIVVEPWVWSVLMSEDAGHYGY
jgi:hypothetical protein